MPLGDALSFLPERAPRARPRRQAVRHGRRIARGAAREGPLRLEADGELLAHRRASR